MTPVSLDGEMGRVAEIELTPTIWRCLKSPADITLLWGSRREGKTVGALATILHHASFFPGAQPIKVAVVRDTWVNLDRSVIDALIQGTARRWWDFELTKGGLEGNLNHGVARLFFFGIKADSDLVRFQGLEFGILYIDDVAPAADLESGVDQAVLSMGMSSLSQAGMRHRVVMTSNPPDEDHWLLQVFGPRLEGRRTHGGVVVEGFRGLPGENPHISQEFRDQMAAGFELEGRLDLRQRLWGGEIGFVPPGTAVTPEFGPLHIAEEPLKFHEGWSTIIRGWDFGLNPTCVWLVVTPLGEIRVLGCVVGKNIGLEQLIKTAVEPWQERHGIGKPVATRGGGFGAGAEAGFRFRDIGDPAGLQREQSNSDRSAAWVLQTMLNTSFEAAPPDWPARRDSVRAVLNQMLRGRPRFQVDPDAKPIIAALRGRWHYHKFSDGRVSPLPVKDMASHPGDALAYVTAVLFPVQETVRKVQGLTSRGRPVDAPFIPGKHTWLSA